MTGVIADERVVVCIEADRYDIVRGKGESRRGRGRNRQRVCLHGSGRVVVANVEMLDDDNRSRRRAAACDAAAPGKQAGQRQKYRRFADHKELFAPAFRQARKDLRRRQTLPQVRFDPFYGDALLAHRIPFAYRHVASG